MARDAIEKMNGNAAKPKRSHPLGPLDGQEITQTSTLIKALWPSKERLHFKAITLQEPIKADLIQYLVAERAGEPMPAIDRRAFVVYYIRHTVSFASSPASVSS